MIMEDRLLLYIAIIVFALAIIGLVLTVLEFRYGAPHQQDEEAKSRQAEKEAGP